MLLLLLSFHRSSTDHRTGEVHVKPALEPLGELCLSPLLFSLYTNDCTSKDSSVSFWSLQMTPQLIGLIQDLSCPHSPSWTALWLQWSHSDSWESSSLRTWSGTITSTQFSKRPSRGCTSFTSWGGFNLPQELLKQFYSAVKSVLCTSITVWFGSATKSETGRLQRTVRSAERIIGAPLPTLQELYTSRVRKRAQKITLVPHIQAISFLNIAIWPELQSRKYQDSQA